MKKYYWGIGAALLCIFLGTGCFQGRLRRGVSSMGGWGGAHIRLP